MEPKYNPATGTVRIPRVPGVNYSINGNPAIGDIKINGLTKVTASPRGAARFREGTTTEWEFGSDPVDRSSTAEDPPMAGDADETEVS
jgi:hypothetical protein